MASLPPLVDTHAHLDGDRFREDLDAVLQRASDQGISHIISVGCDLQSSRDAVRLAETRPNLSATVGIHPHDATALTDKALEELESLASKPDRVVAIGEIGLDYFRNHSPREIQQKAFRKQIALARRLNLPIIVHNRDADADTLRILVEEDASTVGGVIHCFSGDTAMARQCIELGFLISFPATITYPKNEALRDVVRSIPVDHMLVETDCPYLAPQKHRGKRNEPAYVRDTAEAIAAIKGLSVEDVARITTRNAKRLFGFARLEEASKIAYSIRDSLYLNITNRCTNACVFCAKFKEFVVKGHSLKLDHEPDFTEVVEAMGDLASYREVVFCGFGEPLMRLELVKELAAWLKERRIRVRINTDGQANLLYERNILPELSGLVDEISVSLNAPDAATYQQLCQSRFGAEGFEAMCEFIREATEVIPEVVASAVTYPGIDIDACRNLAEALGARFRVREYNEVG